MIGIVLLVIVLFIYGSVMRKKIYDAVDQLEAWKISIMERDVAEQLSQIKTLNLLGETLNRFESWKERWDEIVTSEMYEIEEYLFDAESAADRYRFSQAKKVVHETENYLRTIEKDIDHILTELEELLQSEEKGREEIVDIEPALKKIRRKLLQKRYQFGRAEAVFDEKINQLEEQVKHYFELVESGDYLQAKDLVEMLEKDTNQLVEKMEEFPEIYKAHRFEIPQQLDELKTGMKDMIEDGYNIEHLEFDKEIHTYEKRLKESLERLENGEVSTAKALLGELEDRIKEIYDTLEKEAIARSFIEVQMPGFQNVVEEVGASFKETKIEVEKMKQTYYFEDRDLEKYLSLEKMLTHLRGQLQDLEVEIAGDEKSHSELRAELETGFIQLEELKENLDAFHKRIHNLRKDEIAAKERLDVLRNDLNQVRRELKKSNLPGVPNFIWSLIEETGQKLKNVLTTLEKQPLDIAKVQETLEIGERGVNKVVEATDLIVQQAYLTEQVIQYANRYRSRNAMLAAELIEAERLFRKYEYELALEHAAKAIERVEPGALKRIESIANEREENVESIL